MKILLDTHALLWWLDDDGRLGERAREEISNIRNDVLISVVSLWEITVKVRIGKLQADPGEILEAVRRGGFTLLSIDPEHLLALAGLPVHADHRDPFDHLPVAQAMAEGAVFVSEDRRASRYPVQVLARSGP